MMCSTRGEKQYTHKVPDLDRRLTDKMSTTNRFVAYKNLIPG